MIRRLATIATVVLLALGCDSKAPSEPGTQTAAQPTPPAQPEPPEQTAPEAWTAIPPDALSEQQQAQLDKAKAAQKDLGGTLMKALTASVAEKGFAESVEFCRGESPQVRQNVAAKHGVEIGRTSHKLRNPKNTPPEWAAKAVAAQKAELQTFEGPGGALGVLAPIELAPLCVNCHGPADQLAEGVPAALAEKYPEDQATGFAEGELRGWFWVRVGG